LKFLVTVITFIPLNTSSFTCFFGVIFLTIWTSFSSFLQSFVNKPVLTPILPYFQALFRPPFFSLSPFFQAIKVRINKFTPSGGKSDVEVDTAIKQIVDDALSTDGVIDIFDEVGIKAPSLEILSDEF
jgi:hypothetical protein